MWLEIIDMIADNEVMSDCCMVFDALKTKQKNQRLKSKVAGSPLPKVTLDSASETFSSGSELQKHAAGITYAFEFRHKTNRRNIINNTHSNGSFIFSGCPSRLGSTPAQNVSNAMELAGRLVRSTPPRAMAAGTAPLVRKPSVHIAMGLVRNKPANRLIFCSPIHFATEVECKFTTKALRRRHGSWAVFRRYGRYSVWRETS